MICVRTRRAGPRRTPSRGGLPDAETLRPTQLTRCNGSARSCGATTAKSCNTWTASTGNVCVRASLSPCSSVAASPSAVARPGCPCLTLKCRHLTLCPRPTRCPRVTLCPRPTRLPLLDTSGRPPSRGIRTTQETVADYITSRDLGMPTQQRIHLGIVVTDKDVGVHARFRRHVGGRRGRHDVGRRAEQQRRTERRVPRRDPATRAAGHPRKVGPLSASWHPTPLFIAHLASSHSLDPARKQIAPGPVRRHARARQLCDPCWPPGACARSCMHACNLATSTQNASPAPALTPCRADARPVR